MPIHLSTPSHLPRTPQGGTAAGTRSLLYDGLLVGLLVLLVGLAASLMNDSLWYDEWRSIFNVGGAELGPFSPTQILNRIAVENPWQAPLYYLILAGWGALTGWTEFGLRVLSLCFGLLGACWMYRFGRDLVSPAVGFYAAALLGLSAFFIYFLHEIRGYTLVILLTVILLDSYWRLAYRRGGWKTAALFVFGAAGLPYTHYFTVTSVFAIALFHLVFAPKNRAWLRVPALLLLALVLFLPWLNVVFNAVTMAGADARRFQVLAPGDLATRILVLFGNNSPALVVVLLAGSLLARRVVARYLWFAVAAGFALMVGLDRFVQILVEVKYSLHLFPAIALLAALGVDQLARRGLPPALLLGVWLAGGVWSAYNPAYREMILPDTWFFPWREAVASVDGAAREGDTALVLLPDPSLLEKNYTAILQHYFYPLPVHPALVAPSPATTDERYYGLARDEIEGARRVWLIYDETRRPWRAGPTESVVLPEAGFAACGEMPAVEPAHVSLFARAPDADDAPAVRYADLSVYDEGIPAAAQDGALRVALGFASALPADTYSFGLHVYDSAGELAAQQDNGLPTGAFACRLVIIPAAALSPGAYELRLVVYAWRDGTRLADESGETRPALGTFEVE